MDETVNTIPELDTLNPTSRVMLGSLFLVARRFDEAMAVVQAGITLDASYYYHYYGLGWALSGLGRQEEAIDAFRRATAMAPEIPMGLGGLGAALGLAGRREEALAIFSGVALKDRSMPSGLHS